jgi:molybdate transport system ATP-binding protein
MGCMAMELTSRQSQPDLQVNLKKSFSNRAFQLGLSFTAAPGFTILFGASGAGKSTLLDCIAGLEAPDEGSIRVGDFIFFDSHSGHNLPCQLRHVGYVFQDLALFPHLTVEANVTYGINGSTAARSRQLLNSFRIAHLAARKPRQISGGERQRAALARALATDPRVLLLDEPLAALDFPTRSAIIDDLREWNRQHRIPILYVTHSRDEVFALGERVIVLEQGKVIADGTPHDVVEAPPQETVAQLAGVENIFDATVIARRADYGTMTCRLADSLDLETPLVKSVEGSRLRIGVRAGDILLATLKPLGLSARNILSGKLVSLTQRDVMVVAKVDCGIEFEVHLTLAARDSLALKAGTDVWLVLKTHSCHLMM